MEIDVESGGLAYTLSFFFVRIYFFFMPWKVSTQVKCNK